MGVAGALYALLAWRSVRKEADAQESLLRSEGLLVA
jgi:hypothetical protein